MLKKSSSIMQGYRLFDPTTNFLIALAGIFLIFLPKINLINFGGQETAGIRIDDLVLLALSFLIFSAHVLLKKRLFSLEKAMVSVFALSVFSFILNRFFVAGELLHVHAVVWYAVRLFEYFVFFYVGLLAASFFTAKKVALGFFIWNAIWIALQKLRILGAFTSAGYVRYFYDRPSGITSFPSEMGAVLNILYAFLVFEEGEKKRSLYQEIALFGIFFFFTIITASRSSLVALIPPFLVVFYEKCRLKNVNEWLKILPFLLAVVLALVPLASKTQALVERSEGLLSWSNVRLAGKVWDAIDVSYVPIGRESVAFDDYDMSWWMRIHKWCYALKIYVTHPETYLFGVGPGFAMAALDGGFLRILTECGILGSFAYFVFFRKIAGISRSLYWVVVAFFFNMVFFDAYLAYKPMSLLLLLAGFGVSAKYAMEKSEVSSQESNAKPVITMQSAVAAKTGEICMTDRLLPFTS